MAQYVIRALIAAALLACGATSPAASAARQATFPGQPDLVLRESGPIKATRAGQVIENVVIRATGSAPAIEIDGLADVVVRNVMITHGEGIGIRANSADRLRLDNVWIENVAAPPRGPHVGPRAEERNNIVISEGQALDARRLFLSRGSTGMYLYKAVRPRIRELQGFDFRGPFPRGELIQFNQCINPSLDTFSVVNPGATSWTEDVVSSFESVDPVIRNGYIEGVNSPTGVGVMIEGGAGGTVENVDVRYWSNGAFAAASGADDVTFRNVRAYDGIAPAAVSSDAGAPGADGAPVPTLEQWEGANFRGPPSSGGVAFVAYGARRGTIDFSEARYRNLARQNQAAWDLGLMRERDIGPTSLGPRRPFRMPGQEP